jgi:lysophospholipase L1-like esterase
MSAASVTPGARSGRRRLLHVAATLAVTVSALEVICRIFMGNLGLPAMQLQPPDGRCVGLLPTSATRYTGWALRSATVTHDVNGLGYRGVERERIKDPGVLRILLVGDSFAYGQGVDASEALPAALERVLGASGRRVEVLNFGVPGYNLEENADQYRLFASKWQHDLVLLVLVDNDLSAPFCAMVSRPLWSWSLRHLYLFRAAYLFWSINFTRGHGSPESSDRPAQLEGRLRRGLEDIARMSRERGARAGLILMTGDRINGLPAEALAEASSAARLPAMSARECSPERDLPTVPREGHFSARGNQILAECVAKWLASAGLLDRP